VEADAANDAGEGDSEHEESIALTLRECEDNGGVDQEGEKTYPQLSRQEMYKYWMNFRM